MRIGFFTSIEGWGGSETYLLSLMMGVREAGHVPVLFGIEGTRLWREAKVGNIECVAWKVAEGRSAKCGGQRAKGEDQGESGRQNGVVRGLLGMMPGWVKLLLGNIREVRQLRSLFMAHRVDVLHVNLNGYEVAGVAARLCGIPSIGWHCIMPHRDGSAVRRWLIKWTCRSYTLMGGMSQACVDAWQELSGVAGGRCRMVWNGIDLQRYEGQQRALRLPGDPFVCLAVGRLHPMKGFDILIRAAGLLNDPRLKLMIAGEGSCEADLKRLAREQPCAGAIAFAGHREDVETLYRQADCMVLPSVSHESFGFVLAEAMACGLPLITSDYGPLPEINLDGKTGLVVTAGDPRALAYAIGRLINNVGLAQRLGAGGRERAIQCFSNGRMIDEMLRLYQVIVKDGSMYIEDIR